MNRNAGFGFLEFLVLLLLLLSLAFPRWPCKDYILGEDCFRFHIFRVVGILLTIATVSSLLATIFLILVIFHGSSWLYTAALIASGITALLGMVATFYDITSDQPWCPIVATFSSGISLGLFATLLFDYLSEISLK
ncbi:unnamed protein product [Rodentolepis nana]|uniref:MARVEL domain-containing protein n=1 Tax=Rodentolepis nana TaxID=102285 RepID=A0A0R3T5J0_RODNA|nr:unnamed protein product [Rodentolepis nana]